MRSYEVEYSYQCQGADGNGRWKSGAEHACARTAREAAGVVARRYGSSLPGFRVDAVHRKIRGSWEAVPGREWL